MPAPHCACSALHYTVEVQSSRVSACIVIAAIRSGIEPGLKTIALSHRPHCSIRYRVNPFFAVNCVVIGLFAVWPLTRPSIEKCQRGRGFLRTRLRSRKLSKERNHFPTNINCGNGRRKGLIFLGLNSQMGFVTPRLSLCSFSTADITINAHVLPPSQVTSHNPIT
jgi:hypothetical protein